MYFNEETKKFEHATDPPVPATVVNGNIECGITHLTSYGVFDKTTSSVEEENKNEESENQQEETDDYGILLCISLAI